MEYNTFAKEVLFSPLCLSACWLVDLFFQRYHVKAAGFYEKLGGRMQNGSELQEPVGFGADQDQGTDLFTFFRLRGVFFIFSLIS